MTESLEPSGETRITRYLDNDNAALIAVGEFEALHRGYLAHVRRWDQEPDPLGSTLMRQGLSGACLYLSNRPRDESVAWTINFREPPLNVFITGDAEDGFVTGRVFTDGVETSEESRLFVQSQRPDMPLTETAIDIRGLDVLEIFEAFHQHSEQYPGRFFEYDDHRALMLTGLPGVDTTWIESIDRDQALARVDRGLRILESRSFCFACGCNTEKIKEVVLSVYEDRIEELFGTAERVEVQCPRCGHEWLLSREDLE